jgi:hypothetical protein
MKECWVPAASPKSLAPGTVIAKRYRIEALVGSGGYASVYRATDLTYGFERAIKEVTDTDAGIRRQFELEADLLINTKHPNIPHGYHLVEDRGKLYLVMEYVLGKDLEELLNDSLVQRRMPLEEVRVLSWMVDVCDALTQMHSLRMPIIHRDIKPANIKITPDGRPVLIDFGLAKLQRTGRPTQTAAQGVSPGFAPPEQYMAKGRTDARTDIYGLGATLYACLTGKDPPEAPARLLAQTGVAGSGGAALVPPRKANSRVSEATDRLVMKALELSPTNRQQTAQQLRDEMVAALNQMGQRATNAAMPAVGVADSSARMAAPARNARRAQAPAPAPAGGMRGSGKQVAVGGSGKQAAVRAAAPAAAMPDITTDMRPVVKPGAISPVPRTGQHPALAAGRTGQQPAMQPDMRSGRQPAVLADPRTGQHAAVAAGGGTLGALATREVPAAPAAKRTAAPAPVRSAAAIAVASRPQVASGAWIRFGGTPLSGAGKFMLTFSLVEIMWGAIVLAVGITVALTQGHPFPVAQFAIAWGGTALVVSLIGGQALSRPAYRRGQLSKWKRRMRLIGLTLYTIVLHGVAIWGATIFATDQSNPVLALASFLLFGLSMLVVGVLSLVTALA